MVLDDFGRLELSGDVQSLMVKAPNGCLPPWEQSCRDHLSEDLYKRAKFLLWQSGGNQTFKRRLQDLMHHNGPKILAINDEALSGVKEARQLAIKFLDKDRCMIAQDESTAIKNPGAARTKFTLKELAPRAKWKRIMSGLATPRSPLDLYTQFEFLDPHILGFRSYYAFRGRFAIMRPMMFGGRAVQIVVGYRDIDELQARIEPYSYRVLLEDCYDMPPPQPYTRIVTLTGEQKRLYREMREKATFELAGAGHVTATAVISQILRLHQILCGHTVTEDGKFHEISENRTSELLELLEEYTCKAIIWCAYDADVRRVATALTKEYGEGAVARFWGGNRASRESEEALFKGSPDCRFMVATPDAGGKGRTWDVADLVVNYSYRNDLEKWYQGQDRPKGVGKVRPIVYATLVAPGTVEGPILKALETKQSMAAMINGDNYREWLI